MSPLPCISTDTLYAMFQLWKIHGVMKFGCNLVTIMTRCSNSWKSLRFCLSMAESHSAETASPRLPVRVSRSALPVISASPSCGSSSHTSRFRAWAWMVWPAAHRNGPLDPLNGTGIAPRQIMLSVNSTRIAPR